MNSSTKFTTSFSKLLYNFWTVPLCLLSERIKIFGFAGEWRTDWPINLLRFLQTEYILLDDVRHSNVFLVFSCLFQVVYDHRSVIEVFTNYWVFVTRILIRFSANVFFSYFLIEFRFFYMICALNISKLFPKWIRSFCVELLIEHKHLYLICPFSILCCSQALQVLLSNALIMNSDLWVRRTIAKACGQKYYQTYGHKAYVPKFWWPERLLRVSVQWPIRPFRYH